MVMTITQIKLKQNYFRRTDCRKKAYDSYVCVINYSRAVRETRKQISNTYAYSTLKQSDQIMISHFKNDC